MPPTTPVNALGNGFVEAMREAMRVINGTSVPNDYPISTGKNGRRYQQDQLSLISHLR